MCTRFISSFALLLVAGCSYTTTTQVSPSYNVYSNYDEKIDRSLALYVDASKLKEDVKVSGFACSAHDYPTDAREAFRTSVVKTFENLVREIELVDQGLSIDDMQHQGYDAMVYVVAEDLDVDLRVIPGFWSAEMEAEAEIAASVRAETAAGRVLGSTVEGDGEERVGSGGACEGGAIAVGNAVSAAIEDTMRRLGERLSNAERLRGDKRDLTS